MVRKLVRYMYMYDQASFTSYAKSFKTSRTLYQEDKFTSGSDGLDVRYEA